MYNKKLLTPEELDQLDPSGWGRQQLSQFRKDSRNPSSIDYEVSDDAAEKFLSVAERSYQGHDEYRAWNRGYLPKFGKQGGTGSMEFLYETLQRTYELAERNVVIPPVILEAVDYLVRRIQAIRHHYDLNPQIRQCIPNIAHTNAGLPYGGKKCTFDSESSFDSRKVCRRLVPAAPGFRFVKGKPRIIYQDAISNVRYVDYLLDGVRKFLISILPEYFPKWVNDQILLAPRITAEIDRGYSFAEFDYFHMDEHFSKTVVDHIIRPIYGAVLSPGDMFTFESYVDQMWEQPILVGNYLLTGLHNLFSGQNPTNDFETLAGVVLVIAACLSCCIDPSTVSIYPMGDDLAISHKSSKVVERLLSKMCELANAMGMVAHPDKMALSKARVRFCKKFYYPGAKRRDGVIIGAYPSLLAVNSVLNPESMSQRPGLRAVADLQRMSNAEGSPDFACTVQYLMKIRKENDFTWCEEDTIAYSAKDWWYRVFGESFDPTSSPAYHIIKQIRR